MTIGIRFKRPPEIPGKARNELNPWQYLTENNTFSHSKASAKHLPEQKAYAEANRLRQAFPAVEVVVFAPSKINS